MMLALLLSGCLFGQTRFTELSKQNEAKMSVARKAAIAEHNYPLALAYDDVFLRRSGAGDSQLRADRKFHFQAWLETALAAIGEPTGANVENIFSTLIAFRHEAQRSISDPNDQDPAADLRRQDLATVDVARIAPRLTALAPAMWAEVTAAQRRGEWLHAVQLGHAIVAELPADASKSAQVLDLANRAAEVHLALATQAGDSAPGARVLHAKIAALFGAVSGDLAAPSAELLAATGGAWAITTTGDCGTTFDADQNDLALEPLLRTAGWRPASGPSSAKLAITIVGCQVTDRSWDTVEDLQWTEVKDVTVRTPVYEERCMPDTYKDTYVKGEFSTTRIEWKIPGGCKQEITGSREEKREIKIPHQEQVTMHHYTQSTTITGKFQFTVDGETRELPLRVVGTSADDSAFNGVKIPSRSRSINTKANSRTAAINEMLALLRVERRAFFAVRAAAALAKATASSVAGQALAADHYFFVAHELASLSDQRDQSLDQSAFAAWIDRTYHIDHASLADALAGRPLMKLDLAAGKSVASVDLPNRLYTDDDLNERSSGRSVRRALMLTFGAGPASTASPNGGAAKLGAIGSLAVTVSPAAGLFGFRLHGGTLAGGHGYVDADFLGGYGVRAKGFWLGPVLGLGGDFTTGSQDATPTPTEFLVPPGGYFEYGARLYYAFPKNGTIEFTYSKAFRTSSKLASQKRGDIRFTYSGFGPALSLTYRYAEHLADGDGFFSWFSNTTRIAKTSWLLGGLSF